MLEGLAREIEGLDIPLCGEALIAAFALRDRLEATLSTAVGDFDAAGYQELDGTTSMLAWLRHFTQLSGADARRIAATAKRLRALPVTRGAWKSGALSSGQVQAVMANVSDATEAMFAEQEESVVPLLQPLSVAHTAVAMRHWRLDAEAQLDLPEPSERPRSLYLSRLLDGRASLKGDFDAEAAELLEVALRQAASPDVEGEPARTFAQRRADALIDILRRFVERDQPATAANTRHRPHLNVVVNLDDIMDDTSPTRSARIVGGPYLDAATIDRILCDAGVHRVVTVGRSLVLDLGRLTRTVSSAQWNALVLRDQGCRFPGCDRPPEWCEAHHSIFWSDGGPTDLWNLWLGCSRHHHLVHSPGWHAKLLPDATLEVTTPYGQVLISHPPPRGSPRLAL